MITPHEQAILMVALGKLRGLDRVHAIRWILADAFRESNALSPASSHRAALHEALARILMEVDAWRRLVPQ